MRLASKGLDMGANSAAIRPGVKRGTSAPCLGIWGQYQEPTLTDRQPYLLKEAIDFLRDLAIIPNDLYGAVTGTIQTDF